LIQNRTNLQVVLFTYQSDRPTMRGLETAIEIVKVEIDDVVKNAPEVLKIISVRL